MAWATLLTSPIRLRNGEVLSSLEDAAKLLMETSESITQSELSIATADMLLRAAEAATPEAIEAATTQMSVYLRWKALLKHDHLPAVARWPRKR